MLAFPTQRRTRLCLHHSNGLYEQVTLARAARPAPMEESASAPFTMRFKSVRPAVVRNNINENILRWRFLYVKTRWTQACKSVPNGPALPCFGGSGRSGHALPQVADVGHIPCAMRSQKPASGPRCSQQVPGEAGPLSGKTARCPSPCRTRRSQSRQCPSTPHRQC